MAAVSEACVAFLGFCLASSGIYLVNDVFDLPLDRENPTKRLRPIAAGQVPVGLALSLAVVLAVLGLAGTFLLSTLLGFLALAYLLLTAVYTATLKHVVLLDIFALAGGFVLRARLPMDAR